MVDVRSDADLALELIGFASASGPVVALDRGADADMILRSLRRGAADFLFPPLTAEKIQSLRSEIAARRTHESQPKSGSVFCVLPGKVGSGASTIGLHVAIEAGRQPSMRVLIVDLDVVTGSIGFLLKIKSEFHLAHALEDWGRMDDELWSRLVARSHGVDLLLAPDTAPAQALEGAKLRELVQFWRSRYNLVLLDAPGMPAAVSAEIAAVADRVLMVTTDDLGALHATRRSLEILDQEGIPREHVDLILNRDCPGTALGRESVRRALGHTVFAILPNDYGTIQAAVLDGHPVPRTSKFGRGISALTGVVSAQSAGAPPRSSSFLRRLGLKK
jgi:pilus assembly protein CpaE